MDKKTQEIIKLVMKQICKLRNFNYDIEIHYSEDINKDIIKYIYRDSTIDEYKKIDFSGFNGVALPYEGNGYHIIINTKLFAEITTIIHETTHIIDYYEFRKIYNDGKIDIETHPYYWGFSLFTEFNARYTAHKFYLEYLLDESYNKDIEITPLKDRINAFHSLNGDDLSITDFYNLMQDLGRWYSIEVICKKQYKIPHYSDLYNLLVKYLKNQNEEDLYLLSSIFL